MKRLLTLLLAVLMCMSLVACDFYETSSNESNGGKTTNEQTNVAEVTISTTQKMWTRETFGELSIDVPVNWRKEIQGNSGLFFYPTDNDTDGFLYVGGRGIDDTILKDFEMKKTAMHSLIEDKSAEHFVRHDLIEKDLTIAGYYAVKSYSIWSDYNCMYYYILTDNAVYLVGIDIYETSPNYLEDTLNSVIDSIQINETVLIETITQVSTTINTEAEVAITTTITAPQTTTTTSPPSTTTTTTSTTSSLITNRPSDANPRALYITASGSKYHYLNPCGRGTYYAATWEDVERRGLTACEKCVY
ncbi:MAG: hypothetical protein FWG90_00270 [Oscillospiraceae bacterium]|nr:hypothetical protein [Oscillospiraceae bacterium]